MRDWGGVRFFCFSAIKDVPPNFNLSRWFIRTYPTDQLPCPQGPAPVAETQRFGVRFLFAARRFVLPQGWDVASLNPWEAQFFWVRNFKETGFLVFSPLRSILVNEQKLQNVCPQNLWNVSYTRLSWDPSKSHQKWFQLYMYIYMYVMCNTYHLLDAQRCSSKNCMLVSYRARE